MLATSPITVQFAPCAFPRVIAERIAAANTPTNSPGMTTYGATSTGSTQYATKEQRTSPPPMNTARMKSCCDFSEGILWATVRLLVFCKKSLMNGFLSSWQEVQKVLVSSIVTCIPSKSTSTERQPLWKKLSAFSLPTLKPSVPPVRLLFHPSDYQTLFPPTALRPPSSLSPISHVARLQSCGGLTLTSCA